MLFQFKNLSDRVPSGRSNVLFRCRVVESTRVVAEQEEEWQGLPLMSWPPSGRDTHHETRILRDDVMCLRLDAVSGGVSGVGKKRKRQWLSRSKDFTWQCCMD